VISFRSMSVRYKLTAIMFLIAVIALFCGFVVHAIQDISEFKRDMQDSASASARVIGEYSIVDLAFEDRDAARRTLGKLDSNPQVEQACLYDTNNQLFASYSMPGGAKCPAHQTVALQRDVIGVSESINYQGRHYGTLVIEVSSEPLRQKLRSYFLAIILLTVLLLALSFALALIFQKIISTPIMQMVRTTRAIARTNDYTLRMNILSEDEIGILSREFNNMLDRIVKGSEARDVAEEALRDSENRYRLLIESSPQAIYLEQDDRIIYANLAGLKLYGCQSIEQMKEIGLSTLFPDSDLVLQTYKSAPVEHKLRRSDGKLVDVELSFIMTIFHGRPARQVLAWDISEAKALRQSAERVQRLAALGEFSAILAHEIRNSLGSITLNMTIISERVQLPENHLKTFANMQLGVQRIQQVIKGILDFARPMPPSLTHVNLHRILDRSIQAMESEIEQAGIEIIRQYDPSDPEVVVDPAQIDQVFVNLLANANHAAPPGSKITVSTMRKGSVLEVTISDTGKGIPAADLERIFDPFFTTKPFGSGLGLALVSRILEQHQIPISVESEIDKGTVFTIRFPIH
jgi:PAS domain S-box-containing protein